MNQSGLSSPVSLIHNLPWRIRESLHLKLRNNCPHRQIARWLFRQTHQSDVRSYGQALAIYAVSDAYRHWLDQERRSAVISLLIVTGPQARRVNRVALSLALDRLTTNRVNTAAGNGR